MYDTFWYEGLAECPLKNINIVCLGNVLIVSIFMAAPSAHLVQMISLHFSATLWQRSSHPSALHLSQCNMTLASAKDNKLYHVTIH